MPLYSAFRPTFPLIVDRVALRKNVGDRALALGQGNDWFARTYYELDRLTLTEMIENEFGAPDRDWP